MFSRAGSLLSIITSLTLSVGLACSLATPALADTTMYLPLPHHPEVRSVTSGHGEVAYNTVDAIQRHKSEPLAPTGVNDWSCTPTAAHPNPVVLIHGMSMTAYNAWSYIGPLLKKDGYCVYALNMPKAPGEMMYDMIRLASTPLYGKENVLEFRGLGDIMASIDLAAAFINEVQQATGAKKLDLIGYSEGGTVVNGFLHKYRHDMIDKVITLGGINVGINPAGLSHFKLVWKNEEPYAAGIMIRKFDIASAQMMVGSPVINLTTRGGDTVAGIDYTNIATKYDEFSAPSTQNPNFQKAVPGATVKNIWLQDGCSQDYSMHMSLGFNDRVWAMVRNTLAREHVMDIPCLLSLPLVGNAFRHSSEG